MRVRIFSRAQRDIAVAVAWWRANRPAAPGRLEEELAAALKQISEAPLSAPRARQPELRHFRRVALVETRYYLYYRFDEETQQVAVLRLWHMSRRHAPALP